MKMKQHLHTCPIKEHQRNEITSICTYKQCQQDQRMVCEVCLYKQLHNHGSSNETKLDDFFTYLNSIEPKIEQYKQDSKKIQEFIQGLKQIIKQLQTIVQWQESYEQNMNNIDKIKISNINLEKLTKQQLNSLINIDEINKNQIQNTIQNIIIQLQEFNKQFVKFKDFQEIDPKKEHIKSPIISQNEQHLCYLVGAGKLSIAQNKFKKNIKNLRTKHTSIVKFSPDSKFLLVGDIHGDFMYFSFKSKFKKIFSNYFSSHFVSDILQINNLVIIASQDIIIVDLAKRRVLKEIYNYSFIYCLEFDRINNLIICVFDDKKIKFFDRYTGNTVIEFYNQQKIFQVQLINKSQNLIACDLGSLRLFEIDLKKKKLNLIKEFYYDVQYFRYVQQEQRIIIRNINQLIITDTDFNIIYELQIKGQQFEHSNKFQQLESMNYIIIKDQRGSLKILKNMIN